VLWLCQFTELHVTVRAKRDAERVQRDADIGNHLILFVRAMVYVDWQLCLTPLGLSHQLLGTRLAVPLRSTRQFLRAHRVPVFPS
jgi:hypothetical protein